MRVPCYVRVIQKIEGVDRVKAEEIEELLSNWRSHSALSIRIVDNLKNDYHIQENILEEMLLEIYNNRHLPYDELEGNIYKSTCYRYSLKGPIIDIAKVPEKIGGAKTADEYITGLSERTLRFSGADRANEIVAKLVSDTEVLTPAEKNISFTSYSTWVTWSEKVPHDPFEFASAPDEILKVLTNLGLAHRQEGMSHLLFVYSKSVVPALYYPTIADANLYSYFKCCDADASWGWTQPWNPEEVKHRNLNSADVKPRPEGVHDKITLENIDKPVRILRGTVGDHFVI